MKHSIKIIFVLLLVFSFKAKAKPPISEYTEIPHGLFLKHKAQKTTSPDGYNNFSEENESMGDVESSFSMNEILLMFNQGKYIKIKDDVRKKAENYNITAAKILGLMYKYGYGMEVNYNEAAKWLTRAAEEMDPEAQQHLALMYFKGESVSRNIADALKWLKIASLLSEDEILKDEILKDYKKVLISANRRQKLSAAKKVEAWLEKNNKSYLLEKK